jgi:hypothetical protein
MKAFLSFFAFHFMQRKQVHAGRKKAAKQVCETKLYSNFLIFFSILMTVNEKKKRKKFSFTADIICLRKSM